MKKLLVLCLLAMSSAPFAWSEIPAEGPSCQVNDFNADKPVKHPKQRGTDFL